jgi:hypothetical protein
MFKPKFIYNSDTLSYDRVPFREYYKSHAWYAVAILAGGIALGLWFAQPNSYITYNANAEMVMPSKHDVILGSNEWKDSVFLDYQVRADLYLSRPEFKGTPIQGEMLALAAHNAYDSTGILLPVELCLAQCQWESGMGLKGRSPENNPFNIGEYDSGTVIWFNSTFEGTQAYFYFMCNDYLSCKPLSDLFKNFVNCDGHRYASGPYEDHVPQQYYYIQRWLTKELSK